MFGNVWNIADLASFRILTTTHWISAKSVGTTFSVVGGLENSWYLSPVLFFSLRKTGMFMLPTQEKLWRDLAVDPQVKLKYSGSEAASDWASSAGGYCSDKVQVWGWSGAKAGVNCPISTQETTGKPKEVLITTVPALQVSLYLMLSHLELPLLRQDRSYSKG